MHRSDYDSGISIANANAISARMENEKLSIQVATLEGRVLELEKKIVLILNTLSLGYRK
jgi:hypothetical protein